MLKYNSWVSFWRRIEVAITSLTRNQVVGQPARGFESHCLRWSEEAVVKQMSNHPFCNSPFCCNIIHIITVKNVICKKSLKLPFPDVNAGHMEHVLFTQPKSASAARGSLFEVCMGLYLISCVKVPLFRQNYGLSRQLCDSTGSDSEKIPSKLYFAGIFLLRI